MTNHMTARFDRSEHVNQVQYGEYLETKRDMYEGTDHKVPVVLEWQDVDDVVRTKKLSSSHAVIGSQDFPLSADPLLSDIRLKQMSLDLHTNEDGVVSALTLTCLSSRNCFVGNCKVIMENPNKSVLAKARDSFNRWLKPKQGLSPLALGETCIVKEDTVVFTPLFNFRPIFSRKGYKFAPVDHESLKAFAMRMLEETPDDYTELKEVEEGRGRNEHSTGTTIKIIVAMSVLMAFVLVAALVMHAKTLSPAARRLSSGRRRV
jgi:hypothetical protein